MLDYADHIDMINLKETIPDPISLQRHIEETYSTFCKSFIDCTEGEFDGAAIDCFYDDKGVSSFCLSAEGTPENLNNVSRLFKLKPKNFPYHVEFLRKAKPMKEMYELNTSILNSKGVLVKVSDTKAIELGIIPENQGAIKFVAFYEGDAAFRFCAHEIKAVLNHAIGEFAYISNVSSLYIVPAEDDVIQCRRVRIKDVVEHYEAQCWKVGIQAFPEVRVNLN